MKKINFLLIALILCFTNLSYSQNDEYKSDSLAKLGIEFYNEGVNIVAECNKIPPRMLKEYDACISKSNSKFQFAADYFKCALNIKKFDRKIIFMLIETYGRLGLKIEQEKLKSEIDASDTALVKLKEYKEKLDLGLISQEEYDKQKLELSKYIK